MKKKIIAFVFGAAVCGSAAFAQESGFGAKLGLNLANISGDVEDNSMRLSMHIGGYYTYMISDKFGVQPELVYSGQGTKFAESTSTQVVGFDPFTGAPITAEVTTPEAVYALDYLNIPILAKYYINESFSVLAGPQIGILMGAKYKGEDEDVDVKEFVNGTDFSLGIGLDYQLENGLNFGLRYNLGLTVIESDLPDGADGNKHGVIQIGAGFQF